MADDAAAPEGKLSGDISPPDDAEAPEVATESPRETEPTQPDTAESAAGVDDPVELDVPDSGSDDASTGEAEPAQPADSADPETPAPPREPVSPVKLAVIVGLVVVLALGGVVGWLGYRAAEAHATAEKRQEYLQVGRQAALNLTTIDVATVDADVQRILDSATDSFYDDFASRTQPFVDVVRQAQSTSVGEVTSAGLESEDDSGAQVLVAITVRTSNIGAPEQEPRAWRMRISVKQVDQDVKVSNVEFVP